MGLHSSNYVLVFLPWRSPNTLDELRRRKVNKWPCSVPNSCICLVNKSILIDKHCARHRLNRDTQVLFHMKQLQLLSITSWHWSNNVWISRICDWKRTHSEIFSTCCSKFNVVTRVMVDSSLCQHRIVLYLRFPGKGESFVTSNIHEKFPQKIQLTFGKKIVILF